MSLELRFAPEVRIATGGRTLYGIACPFGQVASIRGAAGTFSEVVAPGAFAHCLASGADISANADHDGRMLLGRTRTNSLKLTETPAGLAYVLDLPETSAGDDVCALAMRSELAGVSIGFTISKDGEAWDKANTRTLSAITLDHVAICTGIAPAYSATSASLRHHLH